jgi:hypothetical protein
MYFPQLFYLSSRRLEARLEICTTIKRMQLLDTVYQKSEDSQQLQVFWGILRGNPCWAGEGGSGDIA